MSERQEKTASRVANIPEEEFDAAVEGDDPPTVSQLADMGRTPSDVVGDQPAQEFRPRHHVAGLPRASYDVLL